MVRVLIVQMQSILGNKSENFKKVENLLKGNESYNADLIVLPELFATGWDCDIYSKVAEHFNNSSILDFLSDIAKKFHSNLIGGSFARKDDFGNIKNTLPVFDRNGKLIYHYDKMHLYSYLGDTENLNSVRGENPVIAETDIGKIGLSICYDIRFPEIYRCYAYNGADILINVAAWPLSRRLHWESLTRARAIENQSFMIAVSQTGEIKNGIYNIGSSTVISPLGETIASLEYQESVLKADFNLEEMKTLRENVKTLSDKHENYTLEV
jgi:predicted amidohydrolase